MKTQAWGWLTAGVLALGLNGFYQDGGAAWAHQMVDRAVARVEARVQPVVAVALAMGLPNHFVANTERSVAQVAFSQEEPASCQIGAAMTRAQAKLVRTQMRFASIEQISARQEAALARMEARMERIRFTPAAFVTEDVPGFTCSRARQHASR